MKTSNETKTKTYCFSLFCQFATDNKEELKQHEQQHE